VSASGACRLCEPSRLGRHRRVAANRRVTRAVGSANLRCREAMTLYTLRMNSGFRRGVVVLALVGAGVAAAPRNPDPAESLARVRLVVTTRAPTAAITVGGATIASYISSVLDGPPTVSASRTGRTLQLSGNVPGQSAEARFDIILADVAPGGTIAWNLTAGSSAGAEIELYSLSDLDRATLVDR